MTGRLERLHQVVIRRRADATVGNARIMLAILGVFVGGSVELAVIGLIAIFGVGLLQVAGARSA